MHIDSKRDSILFSAQFWERFRFGRAGAENYMAFRTQIERDGLHILHTHNSDGNSLFRAFARQVYRTESAHAIVRLLLLNHILSNASRYQPVVRGRDLQEYVAELSRDGSPGDGVTIQALSDFYETDVMVYSPAFPRPVLFVSGSSSRFRDESADIGVFCFAYTNLNQWSPLLPTEQHSPDSAPKALSPKQPRSADEARSSVSRSPSCRKRQANDMTTADDLQADVQPQPVTVDAGAPTAAADDDDDDHDNVSDDNADDNNKKKKKKKKTDDEQRSLVKTPSPESKALSPTMSKKQKSEGPEEGHRKRSVSRTAQQYNPLTLLELCIFAVADCYNALPANTRDLLRPELVAKMIAQYLRAGLVSDQLLHFLLSESTTFLKLSDGGAQIKDSTLRLLGRACPNLKGLAVANCHALSGDGFRFLVRNCFYLEYLDVEGCVKLDDAAVREIALHASCLRSVNLSGCSNITDAAVKFLTQQCPSIRHLSLKKCHISEPALTELENSFEALDLTECPITDAGLVQIASKSSSHLHSLKVNGRTLTEEGLRQLGEHCHNLRHLEINGCDAVSDSTILNLGNNCPNLLRLELANCRNIASSAFDSLFHLQYLDLNRCLNLTDAALLVLARNSPMLRYINLSACEAITDAGAVPLIETCVQIEFLLLSDCPRITDAAIVAVADYLLGIRSLAVHNCNLLTDASIARITSTCRWLQSLDISWCENLTDDSIADIRLPYLTSLNMEELPHISATALQKIGSGACPSIHTLKLGFTQANDATLDEISRGCPDVFDLDLTSCNAITPLALISVLPRWTNLRRLSLRRYAHLSDHGFANSSLQFLNLSFIPDLRDAGIARIVHGCPNIAELDLAYCPNLTPVGFQQVFKNLGDTLKTINIRGCRALGPIALSLLAKKGIVVRT